jgi:hypothetical protein
VPLPGGADQRGTKNAVHRLIGQTAEESTWKTRIMAKTSSRNTAFPAPTRLGRDLAHVRRTTSKARELLVGDADDGEGLPWAGADDTEIADC